jgi:hypothetical protein
MRTPALEIDRATPARADGATFAMTPVRAGRGARLLAAFACSVFGGLVLINTLHRPEANRSSSTAIAAVHSPAPPSPTPRPNGAELASERLLDDIGTPATETPPARLIALDVRAGRGVVFVHGDVHSLSVRGIVVSIEDRAGALLAKRAILLQSGSTAFRVGANTPFEAVFEVSDGSIRHGISVHADAYDDTGGIVGAVERRVLAVTGT